jgi:SSS family solute:Na+ symporter
VEETTLQLEGGLGRLDQAAIVLYLVVTFGIAWWFGRKQKSVDDFLVGGRHMPWFAVGLSILATLFSTLSYLGVPGEMIKHGIGHFMGYLGLPLTATVITVFWIPFFMRLRLTSAYEYLERRFNYGPRFLGAMLFLFLRLGWMSMVIFAASMALDRIKGPDIAWLPGPDLYWWIALIGVIAAVYTSVGGIQAMIWTDVLQCLLLLAGVLLAIGYVVWSDGTGPLDWWKVARDHGQKHTTPPLFSWDVTVRVTVVTAMVNNFFWNICTHGSDQVVLQRYFSTASLQAARRSYFINLTVDVSMGILLSLAGLALLAFYLRHSSLLPADATSAVSAADKLFPHFLGTQLPPGCAGLVMAAFLCDAIQTLESGANAITAVVTNDFVPRLRRGGKRYFSELGFVRFLTVIVSLLVTANAYFVVRITATYELTLVDLMPRFFNMFVGPLAAMFFIGMFLRRCTARSTVPAVLVGIVVSIAWSWWPMLTGSAVRPTPFLSIAVPCLTTMLTAFLLGLVVENGQPHSGWNFTWRAVVKGSEPSDKAPLN